MLFNCSALHNFQEYPAPTSDSHSRIFADASVSPFSQFKESRRRSWKKNTQVQPRQKPLLSCTKVAQHLMSCDLPHCQPVIHNTMKLQSAFLLLPTPPGPYSSRTLVPDLQGWEPGDLCPHTPCSLWEGDGVPGSTRGPIHSLVCNEGD